MTDPSGDLAVSERRRFVTFVATSGFAAFVNVASRYLLSLFMVYEAAVAVAYLVGMTTAFLLARRFVFAATDNWRAEFGKFAMVNVVAFIQVWIVSVVLAEYVLPAIGLGQVAETLGHIIGVGSPIVTSYLMHKHFSFKKAAAGKVS